MRKQPPHDQSGEAGEKGDPLNRFKRLAKGLFSVPKTEFVEQERIASAEKFSPTGNGGSHHVTDGDGDR